MTSKEAIQVLKNHNNRKYELVNKRRYAVSVIEQDLEVLEILKEFLSEANTGTGWIEININPNHDILDSKEYKEKQKKIKEWLENEKSNDSLHTKRKD